MTKKEFEKEFLARCFARKTALSRDNCPEGYAYDEYKEGWIAAFSFAEDIFTRMFNEVGNITVEEKLESPSMYKTE